ncbi:UDP-3-O-acyl-N-acetylglucosamine deacetylase [Candidatus Atelocyanobacterium thalassae]|uniref:UDP-3-O-acyl-N-acetylglucosamine deacetylase n=2 Tax=Candidatus Atelocyanobacterium thalassae TaxID=713887 RepID=A0A086CIH4_9CHRO|nr:UDP-3-O-acyl-N-acetylglucosamine deacetylase [Candidatus Atelocyanobacterium thalassa]KFF41988.1 MAG: UDP-3-O-(3-hydroxymyristoyl) N-acetylglucosamine deacetylase [Candidatus Atelocyanobacterium thalassa isolate SIO64986]BDA39807.1 UDP-3-O-acyl-N-acetylglucosamine deacetylase [cyanobacterium endosymbiont of Braarudosphaera bigelowii]
MNIDMDVKFKVSGVGLHSGKETQVKIIPNYYNQGHHFIRVDLFSNPVIPAQVSKVGQTILSTELSDKNITVRTVEHLLGALTGCGIKNARIEINGTEVPLLDGSAKNWVDAFTASGFAFSSIQEGAPILKPIWVQDKDAFVAAIPAPEICFTYGINFIYKVIGNQWASWNPKEEPFIDFIAPARTFGFIDQIDNLRQAGLIKGGSFENALICNHQDWINPPLRFSDEPVRHKLLDLVGDLSLLGFIPRAHFIAYKASHKLHVQLAQKIAQINQ